MVILGVDTGGTFCDLVQIDAHGHASVHKSPSTSSDNAEGVFNVLDVARLQAAVSPSAFYSGISSIALGTTIATNTVVTHTGAKVGLLTTRGHGDMLSIMRVNGRVAGRPLSEIQNYSVTDKPTPIVPKTLIIELDERIDFAGEVIIPLDEHHVSAAVDKLVESGVRSQVHRSIAFMGVSQSGSRKQNRGHHPETPPQRIRVAR
jgi:N-methylhydantoinase A